ncbi:MAG: hypothetical protein ACRDXX_14575, partial [Stackebrandtia sp.]
MPKNSTATSRSLYPAVIAATATVLLAFAATPAVGQVADTKDPESRDESVVDAMLEAGGLTRSQAESDGRDFQVNVFNEDSEAEWAFGSSVVTAPDVDGEYPDGWMFLAHWDGGEWLVGLHGDQQFQELSDAAPDDVLSSGEKENFDAYYEMPEHPSKAEAGPEATTSYTTELRLPYATGQSWKYTGGPHGSPRASVDLAGGDGRVLAAGSGKVYVMCS